MPARTFLGEFSDGIKRDPETVNAMARSLSWTPYGTIYGDTIMDMEYENTEDYMGYIREDMEADGRRAEFDAHEDEIRELVGERNADDAEGSLMRNTSGDFFYSLGYEAYADDDRADVEAIAAILGIEDEEDMGKVREMVENASYGGELRIYFHASVGDLIPEDGVEFRSVRFSGWVDVAIVDSYGGSGWMVCLWMDRSFTFNRGNLYLDEAVRYSWREICGGMDYGTHFELSMEEAECHVMVAGGDALKMEYEAEMKRVFLAGGCTLGDKDMERHRSLEYINTFPSRVRCKDCGTTWID